MSPRTNHEQATKEQLRFLHELEQLDRANLGCLSVSDKWTVEHAAEIERQCLARRWIRSDPNGHPWGRVLYLTTRGLRVLQRRQRKRTHYQPGLPLASAVPMET